MKRGRCAVYFQYAITLTTTSVPWGDRGKYIPVITGYDTSSTVPGQRKAFCLFVNFFGIITLRGTKHDNTFITSDDIRGSVEFCNDRRQNDLDVPIVVDYGYCRFVRVCDEASDIQVTGTKQPRVKFLTPTRSLHPVWNNLITQSSLLFAFAHLPIKNIAVRRIAVVLKSCSKWKSIVGVNNCSILQRFLQVYSDFRNVALTISWRGLK